MRELTASQIRTIEELPLGGTDRWYVLLTATGDKAASVVSASSDVWTKGDTVKSIPKRQIELLRECFDELALAYSIKQNIAEAGLRQIGRTPEDQILYCEQARIYIATDTRGLDELIEAERVLDDNRTGKALGYPATAVDAYGTDAMLPNVDESSVDEVSATKRYAYFRLSKRYYQQELATVERWLDVLKRSSKEIYLDLENLTNKIGEQMKYEGTKLQKFEPVDSVKELETIDIEVGTGEEVKPGATITAHYTGALCKNGIIFQSSYDFGDAISFGLDQVVKGWTVGVPGMKVGGTRRLIIPAEMAYGENSPASNIPANSDLVFDIDLVDIKRNGQ